MIDEATALKMGLIGVGDIGKSIYPTLPDDIKDQIVLVESNNPFKELDEGEKLINNLLIEAEKRQVEEYELLKENSYSSNTKKRKCNNAKKHKHKKAKNGRQKRKK